MLWCIIIRAQCCSAITLVSVLSLPPVCMHTYTGGGNEDLPSHPQGPLGLLGPGRDKLPEPSFTTLQLHIIGAVRGPWTWESSARLCIGSTPMLALEVTPLFVLFHPACCCTGGLHGNDEFYRCNFGGV